MTKKKSPNSKKFAELADAQIDDSTHTSIGQLIRAFAEIDDILNLYIGGLAETSESRTGVLLGRSNISTKIEIAFYLAKMAGQKITDLHKSIFNADFDAMLKCRNVVAHGALLGSDSEGRLVFLTSEKLAPESFAATRRAIGYHPGMIEQYAASMTAAIPKIEAALKLKGRSAERLRQPLAEIEKGPLPQKKSKTPQPPPRS